VIDTAKRNSILIKAGMKCSYSGCKVFGLPNLQIAHNIHRGVESEHYIINYCREIHRIELSKKQAQDIIDHEYNLSSSCAKHNSRFNCLYDVEKTNKIIDRIIKNI
jgi:hypothetical protein